MQRKETAIEVKVGLLVLLSVAILAGFVLLLGDCSVGGKAYTFSVDFDNAAGLKPGAPVKLSGIPVGKVNSVRFMGGGTDPELGRPVYVRAELQVNDEFRDAIREDASFTITTQGVLGEPYVEISSPDTGAALIDSGAVMVGVDPPRMDQLLQSVYSTVQGVEELVARLNERGQGEPIEIAMLVHNVGSLAGSLDERIVENSEEIDSIMDDVAGILNENRDKLGPIFENVEGLTGEFEQLGASLNYSFGRGTTLRNTLGNVESITDVAAREIEPVMVNVRDATGAASRILETNEPNINQTLDNARTMTDSLVSTTDNVDTIVARLERGEGSIGRFLTDEEIFEDVREFVRELKRRPWRIIWKE